VHQENEYTVTYQIGEPTTQNENVRTDVVTNSRPGIKLFKMLWKYTDPLAGAVFTLKDSEGQDVAAESYTSRSEDGLITIAYLNPGIYTLTEVETPKGYVVLPEPITITVAQDGTISVPVTNQYYEFTPAHEATETPEAEMATVTIRNRTTELHVKKVDAVTKDPLAGAHFALYNQVTDAQGNKRKDYQPITGYENLISNAEGILTFPDTNVEAVTIENLTWGNTYYLTETQAVTDYDLLKEDLCFTVNKDGTITIENAEHSGWLTTSTDTDKGKYSSLIQIPNGKLQYVSVWKTDDGYTTITTGASFALYKAEDYDDAAGRPKEGAVPVLTGTTGETGILPFGALPVGDYRLVETMAPPGYILPDAAIHITISADGVTATKGSENLTVTKQTGPGQEADTWQIQVKNTPGMVLPETGGKGTGAYSAFGLALVLAAAGAMLLQGKKRKNGKS
jgi:LPXTG-motif cell wall-anchored protein